MARLVPVEDDNATWHNLCRCKQRPIRQRAEIAPGKAEDAGGLSARQGRQRRMAQFMPLQAAAGGDAVAYKPNELYRGKRRLRPLIVIPLFLLVLALLAAAVLFFVLQRYIVYDQDGLSLQVPLLTGETAAPDAAPASSVSAPVVAELVIEAPDYSSYTADAGLDLSPVRALYLSAQDVNTGALETVSASLAAAGADALVIDMKPESGRLTWSSGCYMARAFDTAGAGDLTEALAPLKEQGVTLVAQLSCLVDTLLATRDAPAALRAADGSIYSSAEGAWLDPYHSDTREYLTALIDELAEAGFDEILLTNLSFPVVPVQFSQELSYAPTPVLAVSSLGKFLAEYAAGAGVRLSALVSGETLAPEADGENGQDLAFFAQAFDRLYVYTAADALETVSGQISAAFDKGDPLCRFVPVMAAAPDSGSWVVRQS